MSKQTSPLRLSVQLDQRLPTHLTGPCNLECSIEVHHTPPYHTLTLKTQGNIEISCQRCSEIFTHYHDHCSTIAICSNNEIAEQAMSTMDCIVHTQDEIDLLEIITDELHLFCPEKHLVHQACHYENQMFQKNKDLADA